MPGRTLLYGFLGFIAVASTVMMFQDPLNPEFGNTSANPSDWSLEKLKSWLTDNNVPFQESDGKSKLVKLVKQHQRRSEQQRGQEQAGSTKGSLRESDTLLGTQKAAQSENERLERASNLK